MIDEVEALMKFLGAVDDKKCYWAEEGHFTKPGFYYWDGKENVHVPLASARPIQDMSDEMVMIENPALLVAEKAYREHIEGRPMVHAIQAYLASARPAMGDDAAKLREALESLYRAAADYECVDTPALSRDLNKAKAALAAMGDASTRKDEGSSDPLKATLQTSPASDAQLECREAFHEYWDQPNPHGRPVLQTWETSWHYSRSAFAAELVRRLEEINQHGVVGTGIAIDITRQMAGEK